MTLPAPYYRDDYATIYCADCRAILPELEPVDLVLTDPPYPSYLQDRYKYQIGGIDFLKSITCPQIIFWTPAAPFPLDYTGCFAWDKAVGTNTQFELIYMRGIGHGYRILRHYRHNNALNAGWCSDISTGHPSQKPIRLIRQLLELDQFSLILDPFMGSGTTLVAAKNLGRKAIGIEIEEKYCAIAVKRLKQECLPFTQAPAATNTQRQEPLL